MAFYPVQAAKYGLTQIRHGIAMLGSTLIDAFWYGTWFFATSQATHPLQDSTEVAQHDFLQACTLAAFPKRVTPQPAASRGLKAQYHLARALGLVLGLGVGFRYISYYALFIPAYAVMFGPGNLYNHPHLKDMGFYGEKKSGAKQTYPWYLRVLGVLALGGLVNWGITLAKLNNAVLHMAHTVYPWLKAGLKIIKMEVANLKKATLKSALKWPVTHKRKTAAYVAMFIALPVLGVATGAIKSVRWVRNLLTPSRWKKDKDHQAWSAFGLLLAAGVAALMPVVWPLAVCTGLFAAGCAQWVKNFIKKKDRDYTVKHEDQYDHWLKVGKRDYEAAELIQAIRQRDDLCAMSNPFLRAFRHLDFMNSSVESQLKQGKDAVQLSEKTTSILQQAMRP